MDAALKAKWIAALRSGRFKQGRGKLYDRQANAYCCLGVLRKIMHPESMEHWNGSSFNGEEYLCKEHQTEAGLTKREQEQLANKNDKGASFRQIANYIEENL